MYLTEREHKWFFDRIKFISDQDLKRLVRSKRTTEEQKKRTEKEKRRRIGRGVFKNKINFEYTSYNGHDKKGRFNVDVYAKDEEEAHFISRKYFRVLQHYGEIVSIESI